MRKIYLAGPDVFAPEAEKLGDELKQSCLKYGYDAHFPLDDKLDENLSPEYAIVQSCMNGVRDADIVLANLNNFRGSAEHPAPDSGTAWECGYAYGLRKPVIGYTSDENSVPRGILKEISLVVVGDIEKALTMLEFVVPAKRFDYSQESLQIFTLDPEYSDIHDVDATTAFRLGARRAIDMPCAVHISDKRPQIEKYGYKFDPNGYSVEDFECCCNIMIALNCSLY